MAAREPDRTGPVEESPVEGTYVPPNGTAPPVDAQGNPYQPNPDLNEYEGQSGVDGQQNTDLNLGVPDALMDYGSRIAGSPYAGVDYRGQAKAQQARAHTREAQQNEMSAYHLDQMLASDSPLMRRARMQAMAGAGGRGLMNSSIAQGAAMGSMIDRAQPFALQDATAHQRAATESLTAKNQASLTNAELGTRAGIAGMQANANRDQLMMQADMSGNQDVLRHILGMEAREDQQAFQAAENFAQRDWQTKEREGGQEFQNQQREFQNIWQSEENKDRAVERWVELNLQRSSNREVAMAQTLAQIYSNPNLTAREQDAAAARAKEILTANQSSQDAYPPHPVYGQNNTSTRPPVDPDVAAANETAGEVYNSPSNTAAGDVSAALPPVNGEQMGLG